MHRQIPLLIGFLVLIVGCNHKPEYKNPVIHHNSPDPGVYYHEDNQTWYVYTTDRFAAKSKDLVNWTPLDTAKIFSSLGEGEIWDPVLNKRDDGYLYLNYTLNQRLYVARGKSPEGPFEYHAGPLVDHWSIGADYFKDDDGKEYLYWSEGGCEGTSGPWMGELVNNMTALANVQHLFNNADVGKWVTECVVEGPFMLKHKGIYYLTFTGNATGPNYAFGYATAASPQGPFTMYKGNPLFKSTGNFIGPGHVGFRKSSDGNHLFAFYHSGYKTWPDGRYTCVVKAQFKPDPNGGIDILDVPAPSDSLLHYPEYEKIKNKNRNQ